MTRKIKPLLMQIVACLIALPLFAQNEVPLSFINDSTVARYRYDVEERSFATVPIGTSIEDIDLLERDLLKPMHAQQKVSLGVNSYSEPYFEIRNIMGTTVEDWMSIPDLQLLTPQGSYGYDSLGNQIYHFPANDAELNNTADITQSYLDNGFQPIMLFFPNVRDAFVQESVNDGALLTNLPDNAFRLTNGTDEVTYEPKTKTISQSYNIDSSQVEVKTVYSLYAPYGYVPVYESTSITRTDLPNPITRITNRTYSNHVIEDMGGIITKYTDVAHLEVYPNPVSGSYEVIMKGIPEAAVSQVIIRDHLGNIVQTHQNPSVQEDIMVLDASNYPSGVLILQAITQHGLYSTTISKI